MDESMQPGQGKVTWGENTFWWDYYIIQQKYNDIFVWINRYGFVWLYTLPMLATRYVVGPIFFSLYQIFTSLPFGRFLLTVCHQMSPGWAFVTMAFPIFFWFFGRCYFLFNLPSLRSYKIHLQPPVAFREPQLCRTRGRLEAILENPDPCTYWGWPCQMHVDLVAYGCRVVMEQYGQNSTAPLQQCKFTPESLDSRYSSVSSQKVFAKSAESVP